MNLSLTRRRGDDEPVALDPDQGARSIARDAVDDALHETIGRELFSSAEAVQVLARVRARIGDRALDAPATSVLDAATDAFERDALVDGGRVTDALLDLRLAMRR